MDAALKGVFNILSNSRIEYLVLRGYLPIEEIDISEDIDLYVDSKDKQKLVSLLLEDGWYVPSINVTKYPHLQFFKFTSEKNYKIDVVFDLYFGHEFFNLKDVKKVFEYKRNYKGVIYTPDPYDALVIFLLHLVFDKKNISPHNKIRLVNMMDDLENSIGDSVYKNYYVEKIKSKVNLIIDDDPKALNNLRKLFLSSSIIRRCPLKMFYSNVRIKYLSVLAKIRNTFRNKSVCLIGVDGSGKSSTIEELKKIMGDKAVLQYMGFRSYETRLASKYNSFKSKGVFQNFIETLVIYLEMWYRYVKNRFDRNRIVVFDRFTSESYINARGIRKIMTTVLFKYMFPKPKLIYYLHCPVEVSLNRKDDILDEEKFKYMKKEFDSIYIGKRKVLAFDSSLISSTQIAERIYKDIILNMAEFLI